MAFLVGGVSCPEYAVNEQYPRLINSATNGLAYWKALLRWMASELEEERKNQGRVDQGLTGSGQGSDAGYVGRQGNTAVAEEGDARGHTKNSARSNYG